MKQPDFRTLQDVAFFEANYFPLETLHLTQSDKKYLGDRNNRVCRFCNRNDQETAFTNESHAIPEFIGNKILIANYECDKCNAKFSRLLENHLANYMHLYHTTSQVAGKNGVPTFKGKKKLSRIDVKKIGVKIDNYDEDIISEINEANKTITINSIRPSYIPVAVFKCFAKMALTLMPEDELTNFKLTLEWIQEEDHEKGPYTFRDLKVLYQFYGGIHPFDFITIGLLRRRENAAAQVPYMVFFIAYSNYYFQIHLPLSPKDSALKEATMHFFPAHAALNLDWTQASRKVLEMKGKTYVRGEKQSITLQAESIEHTWSKEEDDKKQNENSKSVSDQNLE
jgi:hypothetical protein